MYAEEIVCPCSDPRDAGGVCRACAVVALRRRRAARGMRDPLNRLRAYTADADPVAEIPADHVLKGA